MVVIDLSHPLEETIPMFPGLPAPEFREYRSRAEMAQHYTGGTSFVIHRYCFVGNSGTYLDSPFHRYVDGADLAELPLDRVADLPGLVVDAREHVARGRLDIGPEHFHGLELAGVAVLVCTGWDRYWGSEQYLAANPFLTEAAAQLLVERGAVLVGIDSWNVDDVADGRRPAHSVLLRAGIPILENLCNLEQLLGRSFHLHAAPLPIRGGSAVPVRAYAVIVETAAR